LPLLARSSISFREAQSYYKTSTPWKGWAIGGKRGADSRFIAEQWNMAPFVSLPAPVLDTLLLLRYAGID
jgi:hypothetical protein